MKRSPQILALLIWLCLASAHAQIVQIDRSKLPQAPAIQEVYDDLLPIDRFARAYEQSWRFPVPKLEVASRLQMGLDTLLAAQKKAPENRELQIFTGLIAHLAYNVDIEKAYEPAMTLLEPLAGSDFRAAWFLAMQRCQSNDPVGGMQMLFKVEGSSEKLSRDFWQDYANCSSVTNMPMHTIRAYDNARALGDRSSVDSQMEQIARNRIEPSDATKAYPAKEAWSADPQGESVRFTSDLCGESFATKPTAHVNVVDVAHGSCTVTIETDEYPNRHGASTATLLLLTQAAGPNESLEQYAKKFLNNQKYSNRSPIQIQCPVHNCLAYEILTDKLYSKEGGAHLIALIFESDQPDYPGLRFEEPQPLPSQPSSGKEPTYYAHGKSLQRFRGTVFTLIALDANQDIYSRARVDFDNFVKSLVVDSK